MTINQGFSGQRKKYGIEVQGIEEVNRNLSALAEKYGKAVTDAALAGGQLVRSTAIKSIQGQSSGREVTRSRNGGGQYSQVASAPGSAPNTDTGRLVSSILVDVQLSDVFVGSTLEYAGHLEFGTVRMDPRPWLNPALEKNRRTIENLFRQAVDRVTERSGDV